MAHTANSVLSMPALGRPFTLGMLYDARNDSLVPGLSLWNKNELSNNVRRHSRNGEHRFEVDQKDTIRDRCCKFDMNIGLKLSFLGGLVNVGGSASYLYERLAASTYERVTSHFSSVTHFEELTMDHLDTENITFPRVLGTNLATHVCVGIEYGAKAFLMFEAEKASSSENKAAKGNLKLSVSKLSPSIDGEGNGNVELSENEKTSLQNVTVKYYGDVKLDKAPACFADAAEAVREIPIKVNEDSAVALKVYLLSLSTLSESAAKVVELVHDTVFDKLEDVTYGIYTAEQEVEKMLEKEVCKSYTYLSGFLSDCHSDLRRKKAKFTADVSRELVNYRSGESNDISVFESLLKDIYGSFFDPRYLGKWIDDQKCKLQLLEQLLVDMEFATVQKNATLFKTMRTSVKHCLVFSVEVGVQTFKEQIDNPNFDVRTCADLSDDFRCLFLQFKEFVESNSSNDEAASFMVIPGERNTAVPEHITGRMTYYGRRSETKNFIPPSTPQKVKVTETDNFSATLQWDHPEEGKENITGFEVHYWEVSIFTSAGKERAIACEAGATSCVIAALMPSVLYSAKVRSLCEAGWSSWSPEVEVRPKLNLLDDDFLHWSVRVLVSPFSFGSSPSTAEAILLPLLRELRPFRRERRSLPNTRH